MFCVVLSSLKNLKRLICTTAMCNIFKYKIQMPLFKKTKTNDQLELNLLNYYLLQNVKSTTPFIQIVVTLGSSNPANCIHVT